MQQRIAIARALLHKPTILLLDEPETGLDQQATSMLWNVLQNGGERKRTIVLTTHNLERGLELGERLIILARGEITYESSRQSLSLAKLKEAYQHYTEVEA